MKNEIKSFFCEKSWICPCEKNGGKMEEWSPLQDYPGYSASNLGKVRNDKRMRELSIVRAKTGHVYVCLVRERIQVKRSLSKLIAETFVPKWPQPHFTTPINLDSDLANCQAINLDWRPRWFAIKYTRQFNWSHHRLRPVRDKDTKEVFEDAWALVMSRGLLFNDIAMSVANCTYVFPTMQSFEWAE
jgi:hypothetical protein